MNIILGKDVGGKIYNELYWELDYKKMSWRVQGEIYDGIHNRILNSYETICDETNNEIKLI